MWKKTKYLALSMLLVMSAFVQIVSAAMDPASVLVLENDFVQISVHQDNGRFSIRTKEGHPLRVEDDDQPLLFAPKIPDTSFTTFRINGQDYIYGNDYGFLGSGGKLVQPPASMGLNNQSVWEAEGLEIVQILTLVDDISNPNVGNVKITYQVTNKSEQNIEVGARILLDTMLGTADASPVALAGAEGFVRTERSIDGRVPLYWRAADQEIAPKVMSYGFLHGWNNLAPNRMVVAHWDGISRTKWDYEVDETLDFTSNYNKYGTADSAVALYWTPASLLPGEQRTYETYYGLGSFVTSLKQAKFASQLMAVKQLEVNETQDGYIPEEFEISLEIDNTTMNAEQLHHVRAEISMQSDLALARGESAVQSAQLIEKNGIHTFTWKVSAKPQRTYKAAQYWVRISAKDTEDIIHSGYVILPALSGDVPDVQIHEMLPDKLYRYDEKKILYIKGAGFEALRGNWDAEVELIRERDGYGIRIEEFDVADDKQIIIDLTSVWGEVAPEPGLYKIMIDAGVFGRFSKSFELTEDKIYMSKHYGILSIVGDGDVYTIQPAASEAELEALMNKHERILLTIRGDIRELTSDTETLYEIRPGATINSVVKYDESQIARNWLSAAQTIAVQKRSDGEENYIEIAGVGALSIPNFTFMQGRFSLEFVDGVMYQLEPDEDEDEEAVVIHWDDVRWMQKIMQMSFFPVKIKNVVLGEDSLSFGGSLSLSFKGMNKSEKDDDDEDADDDDNNGGSGDDDDKDEEEPFSLSLDLDEARFGLQEDGAFGFIGLRAEGEVEIPDEFIPGLEFGTETKMLIDTLDHIYEIDAEVSFEIIELSGLMTIRFTDSMIPILDNFVFSVGGEPGIPITPNTPVAYITKGGGGIKNIYDTLMGNFVVLPPLKLVFIGGMDIAKIISAETMTLEASVRGIEFEGEFELMKIDIIDRLYGHFLVEDTLDKLAVGVQLGADIDIYDIIVGEIYAAVAFDSSQNGILGPFSMRGGGNVDLKIPDWVKLVGGTSLASVNAEVGTEGLYARARALGAPIEIEYQWGDSAPTFHIEPPKLIGASELRMAANDEIPGPSQTGIMSQDLLDGSGEMRGTITYGTNIRRSSASGDNRIVMNRGLADLDQDLSAALGAAYDIDIGDFDYALLEFSYDGELPSIELRDPSGDVYETVEGVNALWQEIPADQSESGKLEKYLYVTIEDPMPGKWRVTADTPVKYVLYEVNEPSNLTEVHVRQDADGGVEVEWELSHAVGDERIALYVTTNDSDDPGVLIEDAIDAAAGSASFTLPAYQSSGDYYVKAVLYNDERSLHSLYSSESLRVVNEHEPDAPRSVQSVSIGEGLLQVDWELPSQVDGFLLAILDEQGERIRSAGEIVVSGDKRSAVIGGLYEDPSGQLIGIKPGQAYTVSVTPFKEVDGVKVYGKPALSPATYIPEPHPANLHISVDATAGRLSIGRDELGEYYRVNASSVMLTMEADQEVVTTLSVNDEPGRDLPAGSSWSREVALEEGMNVIRVLAVNEQGDYSQSAIRVMADTTPPDLKIESPGSSYPAQGGIVEVRGVAEPGSKVTINGMPAAIGSNGLFAESLSMGEQMTFTVKITAEDEAGNRTEHEVRVVNSDVAALQKIEIVPYPALAALADDAEDSSHRMKIGESQKFEVIGYDLLEKSYKIDPADLEWEFLLGSEYGLLADDGTLQANAAGEMVIRAAYRITDEYVLEDVIIVQAERTDGGDVERPIDYDDWYVEPDRRTPIDQIAKPETDPVDVDDALEDILKSIIEAEDDVEFLFSVPLASGRDTRIPIGERALLYIHVQEWGEHHGIGVGKVRRPAQYEHGPLRILGDIYELRIHPIAEFARLPEFTIHIALEDVQDVHKLGLYWYNDRERRWELLGNSFNILESGIKVTLPHLGKFALIEHATMKRFADMNGRWSQDLVHRLASIGVIDGVEREGSFEYQPTRPITRQEFAKLMTEISGLARTDSNLPKTFADLDEVSSWAYEYLSTAVENGWISGSRDGDKLLLQPARAITRAEAAAMIARMLEGILDATGSSGLPFQDVEQIPGWAASAVEHLYAAGILTGYPDGTFRPADPISREESAAIFVKMIDYLYRQGRSIM